MTAGPTVQANTPAWTPGPGRHCATINHMGIIKRVEEAVVIIYQRRVATL